MAGDLVFHDVGISFGKNLTIFFSCHDQTHNNNMETLVNDATAAAAENQYLGVYNQHFAPKLQDHVDLYVAANKTCLICNISEGDKVVFGEMVREMDRALQDALDPQTFVLPDIFLSRKFATFHPQNSEALTRNLRRLFLLLTSPHRPVAGPYTPVGSPSSSVVPPGSKTHAFLDKLAHRGYQSPFLSALFLKLRSVPMEKDIDDQFKQHWVQVIEHSLERPLYTPAPATTLTTPAAFHGI